jgi:hypothetical protein
MNLVIQYHPQQETIILNRARLHLWLFSLYDLVRYKKTNITPPVNKRQTGNIMHIYQAMG